MTLSTQSSTRTVGVILRKWRQRRRYSQLALAYEADVSPKHLSFIESGRAQPSREMLLHLAEQLNVPLRDRNTLLLSAGFAPKFDERPLDHPTLRSARQAIDLLLKAQEPFPALVIDRYWNIVLSNAAVRTMLAIVSDQSLLTGTVNVLRLSLSPGGLAPHILNFQEWRSHLLDRLHRQVEITGDPKLIGLEKELALLPNSDFEDDTVYQSDHANVFVPLKLATPSGSLSFLSTVTAFGTPTEITLSELTLEAFYPANDETAVILKAMADSVVDFNQNL